MIKYEIPMSCGDDDDDDLKEQSMDIIKVS